MREEKAQVSDRGQGPVCLALILGITRYAQSRADRWYILSAKFGLLKPNKIVAPYDVTLNSMTREERALWGKRVIRQLVRAIPRRATVILLAGQRYRENIEPYLRERCHSVKVPFSGLSIGWQLSRLKQLRIRRDLTRRRIAASR
jgi:hypothetical protein